MGFAGIALGLVYEEYMRLFARASVSLQIGQLLEVRWLRAVDSHKN